MRAKIQYLCGCNLVSVKGRKQYHCPTHGQPLDWETVRARKRPKPRKVGVRYKIDPHKDQVKRMDALYSVIVKARANWVDEVTGKAYPAYHPGLDCHHLISRKCMPLRYEFDNGVCVASGTHRFRFHGPSTDRVNAEGVIAMKRPGVFERLEIIRKTRRDTDLNLMEIALRQEAERLGCSVARVPAARSDLRRASD